jgi:hypothetical protein
MVIACAIDQSTRRLGLDQGAGIWIPAFEEMTIRRTSFLAQTMTKLLFGRSLGMNTQLSLPVVVSSAM